MPFWIAVVALQLALLVHAMRTQRDTIWVWILLLAPLVGAAAYLLVEVLPDLADSRRAARRRALRSVGTQGGPQPGAGASEPDHVVSNALAAAQRHYDDGEFAQGLATLQQVQHGAHKDDPDLMLGIARMQFELGDAQATIDTLDRLKARNPNYRSPQGHVLYARAQGAVGDIAAAIHEYEALCDYYSGPEPYVRFADLLKAQGDVARARTLYFSVLEESEQAGKLYSERHKVWVDAARAGYADTASA